MDADTFQTLNIFKSDRHPSMQGIGGKKEGLSIAAPAARGQGDPDAADKTGFTPVFIAAIMGQEGSLRLLLAARADPHAANKNGATPVFAAAKAHAGARDVTSRRCEDCALKQRSIPLHIIYIYI